MPLSGNQRRHLRALGHHLQAIVQVGHQGVTAGVVKALDQALSDHELVKVRLAEAVEDRAGTAEALAEGTKSELAQLMGRTVLLYRPDLDDPKIELPAPRREGAGMEPPKKKPAPEKAPPAKKSPSKKSGSKKSSARKSFAKKAPTLRTGGGGPARGRGARGR
jgi:RNA-binding protein